ncbi:hypothetical protein SUGI_0776950 [Cryptomeria japonica]|nr:hypothetical protein SUGI_0776950 [Cryptomeria japonica]
MASILDPQILLHRDVSIIDCNWYYGCLFSPKKNVSIHPVLVDGVDNNHNDDGNESHPQLAKDDRGRYSSVEKNGGVDDHNDDGNGSHPQFAKDDRGQHSSAEKNGRYEESLQHGSGPFPCLSNQNKNSVPCFGPIVSDPSKFCKEDIDEEAECVACIFRVLDEDGDGRVSVDEIMRFLERLNLEMPKEEVQLAVRSVSLKGELESAESSLSPYEDEFLNAMEFAEFYRFVFSVQEEEVDPVKAEEDATCEAFGMFDQNGDGFISAMELADVLCRLGFTKEKDVKCCQSMIESVDYNGDGFVDIHEFRHLITRTTYPPHPCLYCVSATSKA